MADLVFLGAGASVEIDVPAAFGMTDQLLAIEQLQRESTPGSDKRRRRRLFRFKHRRRSNGTAPLDATRVGRDAGRIADEVISHLSGIVRAKWEASPPAALGRFQLLGPPSLICYAFA